MFRTIPQYFTHAVSALGRAVVSGRISVVLVATVSVIATIMGTQLAGATAARTSRVIAADQPDDQGSAGWSPEDQRTLRSLSLSNVGPLANDPSNRVANDDRAAALGQALFFDVRLSGSGKVSCASCHAPAKEFQDGKPLAEGMGTTARRTMPIAGTAHSPWQFWDGRADSQWEQALGPLESAAEHGGTRTQYAHEIAARYKHEYAAVFGILPNLEGLPRVAGPVADTAARRAWQHIPASRQDDVSRIYANIGKAIAAFERRVAFTPSRFDLYVDVELAGRRHSPASSMSPDETEGLHLFIGKANCINCHNGPRFTDDHFHNTGVPPSSTPLPFDSGRAAGALKAVSAEFSCTSRYSDAKPDDCAELRFAVTEGEELMRAFKTPSLRNVAERAPYMHAGQLSTLTQVISHYDRSPAAPAGHTELKPLRLSPNERRQIEAFLRALSSPVLAPPPSR